MVPRSVSSRFGMVSLFVRHRNAANLVMILMIIFGVFAMGRINTQFFPTTEIPVVSVSVSWPGASADDVESNILEVMEPELRFLDGVERVTSRAREGVASIGLEYAPGTDMKEAEREVETVAKGVQNLPEDSETPEIRQSAFFDRVARLAVTGPVSEKALRFYAKKIRDDLIERGIDKVSFTGMRSREIHIDVPERELRRIGQTVGDISTTIQRNSRDLPSGQMDGNVEKQLRTLANKKTPQTIGEIEIAAFATGEKVRLNEIASVKDGFNANEPRGFMNGQPAIQLDVQRAETADTLATNEILNRYLKDIENALPAGLEVKKYDVRADPLQKRILLLVTNGLGGLVLVVGILFIFLNARIAFWVAAGIPVAMLATIGLMWVSGQTINMISLFALIMMLGIIVDDAIVVGEHTATRFEQGDEPYAAAENGAGRMIMPVSAAMITTIAAFGPMLVIGDVLGQIIGVMPFVVIAVVIASLVECFLILPGHLAHTLQPRRKRRWSYWRQFAVALTIGVFAVSVADTGKGGWFVELTNGLMALVRSYVDVPPIPVSPEAIVAFIQQQREAAGSFSRFVVALAIISYVASVLIEAVIALYVTWRRRGKSEAAVLGDGWFRRNFDAGFNWFRDKPFNALVSWSFSARYLTIALAVAAAMVGAWGMVMSGKVGFVFFPSTEAENINARLVFNAGLPEAKAIEAMGRVEAALRKTEQDLTDGDEKLIIAAFTTLGRAGRSTGDNVAEIRVQLTTSEERTVRTPTIVRAWRKAIPNMAGVRRVSLAQSRGGPPGRDIDIQLQGPDIAVLKQAATAIVPLVDAIAGTSGVSDDLPYGKPELTMQLTPRGAALGFSIEDVGRQLRNAFEGAIPRRFADGDDEITVRVSKIARNSGTAALRNFELRSAAGDFVPLSQVVEISEQQGFAAIERIDGKATVSVGADIDDKINTTEKAIESLEVSGLPELVSKFGITYKYSGRDQERRRAFADLQIGALIALAVIYIVLAWVFASYWRPFAVMLIIPFGIVGAVLGHWLIGLKLTILSVIGLLGLAGILVNDSIILVSRLDERLKQGNSMREAAIGASRDRLRAVLLTSLTTIGGLVPLMFEKSLQAQFLLPMATTMVFGLASATLLVLFLVPAFVGVGDDIGRTFRVLFGTTKMPAKSSELQPAE